MISRNAFARRSLAVLAASGALTIASCGGEDTDYGLGQLYPVSGTVTYNGTPLEKGQISFAPEDLKTGVGASGSIENGSYAMGTVGDKNGARPGKYKVVIIAKEDTEAQARAEFEKAESARSSGTKINMGKIPPEFAHKAAKAAKSLIPAGYGDLRTTTLTAEVKEGPNPLDFKLTDADAPPDPPKDSAKGKGRRK
jgi:hypothetical protein